jgi:ubiquinone/menaquinone biosynthesis C-methylase UbiE
MKQEDIIAKYSQTKLSSQDSYFIFMNDGYTDIDENGYPIDVIPLKLNNINKHWKYQANMYYKALSQASIFFDTSIDKTYLDLGCGRGGGIDLIIENYQFKNIIGIDITPYNIDFCKKYIPNTKFFNTSASDLSCIEDKSIDVITSIESCGYYEPFSKYIEECYRVLKPGGVLIQASPYFIPVENFIERKFKFKSFLDITYNVHLACSISKIKGKIINSEIYSLFSIEEKRYENNSALYNILVFEK